MTNCDQLIDLSVLDIDINLLDHIPILDIFACDDSPAYLCELVKSALSADVTYLRWDQAPLELYYEHTRLLTVPLFKRLDNLIILTCQLICLLTVSIKFTTI